MAGIKFELKLELGWLGGKVAKDFVSQLGRLCVEVHHGAYQGSPGYFVYDAFAALWLAFKWYISDMFAKASASRTATQHEGICGV